jgi:ribosomal protein S18 acetylase RimI-like enzyme
MNLVPASVLDIDEIHHLANKIWTVHYPPIIGNVQVDYMLKKMYSKETLKHQISEGKEIYFLIQSQNENIGYTSIEIINNTEAFIVKFYILSNKHRSGIGEQTFNALVKYFDKVNTFKLQVNRQNYKAINFYFKVGFVIEKVEDFDIGDGYQMNDFIMIWKRK